MQAALIGAAELAVDGVVRVVAGLTFELGVDAGIFVPRRAAAPQERAAGDLLINRAGAEAVEGGVHRRLEARQHAQQVLLHVLERHRHRCGARQETVVARLEQVDRHPVRRGPAEGIVAFGLHGGPLQVKFAFGAGAFVHQVAQAQAQDHLTIDRAETTHHLGGILPGESRGIEAGALAKGVEQTAVARRIG